VRFRRRLPGRVLLPTAAVIAAALTVLVWVHWSALYRLDRRVVKALSPWVADHDSVRTLARGVTHLGDPWVVTAATVVVALVLVLRRRLGDALLVLFIRLLAAVLSSGMKVLVDRPRPADVPALTHVSTASYPSGHALGSAALWATLVWLASTSRVAAAAWWIGLIVPLLVAASRVLLRVHFPSDVIGGLLLGWLAAGLVVKFGSRR
jgi:membrane-associated phospholipid phosphatase